MRKTLPQHASALLALSLAGLLAGCGGMATNRSVDSVNQPVVEKTNYVFDVSTGPGGLALPEQRRLAGWFDTLGLRYGDKIFIDDPLASGGTRAAVEAVAARYGMLLSEGAPVTQGYVNAGTARIVVVRATASVPNCPNWRSDSDVNLANATSKNYGCAVNSNLAAMMADPEHLVKGAEASDAATGIAGATKAIQVFRDKPAKAGEVTTTSSKSN
ncbi:MAG: CpaD family pilus assembly protein [Sphingomonadales bacterium]|nr:CpaD family pilus assembly protein [Sphingomonadales bacterium]